ncbi:MAG: recombination protein O N-terminal domain-containing protein [Lewinellaceae bacterium]|nr:recombination protein O N-terminal domain-containing protein [Lewinellaceae bacterium]
MVFRTVKYGETSVIADIFTEEKGLCSFIGEEYAPRRPYAFQSFSTNVCGGFGGLPSGRIGGQPPERTPRCRSVGHHPFRYSARCSHAVYGRSVPKQHPGRRRTRRIV